MGRFDRFSIDTYPHCRNNVRVGVEQQAGERGLGTEPCDEKDGPRGVVVEDLALKVRRLRNLLQESHRSWMTLDLDGHDESTSASSRPCVP